MPTASTSHKMCKNSRYCALLNNILVVQGIIIHFLSEQVSMNLAIVNLTQCVATSFNRSKIHVYTFYKARYARKLC